MTSPATSPLPATGAPTRYFGLAAIGQTIGSFAAVITSYWLYWLIVVPLVEPGLEPENVTQASDDDIRLAREAVSARKKALAEYFPPGSWELENPAIWENGQTRLLFKEPTPLEHGQLKVRYCTLLYFPPARGAADVAETRPIIMRAPDGATIQFEGDEPIDLASLDGKRRLIGGALKGPITISRAPSRPGAADDLLITTRDVELRNDRAYSPHPVNFRMGKSHGSGNELEILLDADDAGTGGFRSGKVRSLLLKRNVVMHLSLDDAPGAEQLPPANPTAPAQLMRITCQGPFEYDFERFAASFNDQVDVVQLGTAESDVLNCKVLTVFFDDGGEKPPGAAPPTAPGSENKLSKIPVQKIEARGDPVTLRSPSRGIYIHCRGLDYQPAPAPAVGRMMALGPGVLQGNMPDDPVGKFQVQWTRGFRFDPAEGGQYVASLDGGAIVRMASMGEISAKDRIDPRGAMVKEGQIFAWVTPKQNPPGAAPPGGTRPAGSTNWQIERVMAQGNVVIDTPQLNGNTGKLETWIERPTAVAAAPPSGAAVPAAEPLPPARKPQPPLGKPTERFAVRSGIIQVKLVPDGESFNVASVTLDAQAHLEQLTPKPGASPMIVVGDRLHVADANTEQTRVTVSGKLARVEAQGVVLLGETIELEKHTNRLWVEGAGRMIMPMQQDLNGKPLARPQSMEIAWQQSMSFQGDTVVFERGVTVVSGQQGLNTAKLEAVLERPIDFSNAGATTGGGQPGEAPQLSHIRTYGETLLHSRELDPVGQQTSAERMQVFDLAIDRISGKVQARGPGWLKRVARQSDQQPLARLGFAGQQQTPAKSKINPNQLTYLDIHFERQITGNLHHREMTFGEPTKTIYGQVAGWDATLNGDDPAGLGPEGMVMHARTLTVQEMPARDKSQRGWFELAAEGNVVAEGQQFVAVGHRATYSQDKDHLILEGDGRSPAQISGGVPRSDAKANKITYAIALQHVIVLGAQTINVDVPQNRVPKLNGNK